MSEKYKRKLILLDPSKSLEGLFPDVAKEWHPTKNGELSPSNVASKSNRKVWWICPQGHEYEMVVSKRTVRNQGCPFCSGKRFTKETSFGGLYPELVKDWDYEKNIGVSPFEVSKGNDYKAWWICPNGHSYRRSIYGKIQSPECPYCKGIKASKENSLATTNPELAKEWDYSKNGALLPQNVLRASHKKVWWICPNGHSYQSVIASRTLQGTSCPICDSEKRTSFPEQAIGYYLEAFTEVLYRSKIEKTEMDIFLPKLNVAIEYDGSYFHSRKGSKERDAKKNEFLAKKGILLLRVAEKKKGPVDSSPKKTKYGYLLNVLYSQNYLFIDALMTVIGQILLAERQVCCKFDVDIDSDRTKIIGRYVTNIKENSVAFKKPIGIKKWDYDKNGDVNPETIPVSSKKRFFWVCPTCGYHWQGAVENLTDTLTCIKCVHADERTYDIESKRGYSLADLFPSIASEWHPTKNGDLTPKDVTPGSNKKVWWKCSKCGNEWEAIIKTRTKGYGCKRCSYEKRTITTTKKRGNIFDFFPELLKQWDYEKNKGIDIKTIAPTSKKEYWWKCPKGHSYLSSPVVKKGSQGCPVCSGKRTDSSNSLASNDPELAKLWDYTKNADEPTKYTCNSGKEKWWICPSCNASFYKRIQQMHKGKRCPICGVKYRK